jgi:hypothetical protein
MQSNDILNSNQEKTIGADPAIESTI